MSENTVDDDTRISPGVTAGQLRERFEGGPFLSAADSPKQLECDFCSTGVSYASRPTVAQYLADDVLGPYDAHPRVREIRRNRPMVQLATYCPDCSHQRLFFPCEGYTEVRMFCELVPAEEAETDPEVEDAKAVMQNVRVTDVSQRDDGIPWDPMEVNYAITQTDYEKLAFFNQDLWGPENVVTFYLSAVQGVDIRELVQWDGSIDGKALGQARRKFTEFTEKMRKGGFSRRTFRDHVTGDDR